MNVPLQISTPQPVRLTVDDYLLLAKSGALDSYPGTELVDGTIYLVSPIHRPHGYCRDELAFRMRIALQELGSDLHVATEGSVELRPRSMPVPDIILTSEPRGEGPIPVASVALLVEVSRDTVQFDLTEKATAYASACVPEYWVFDLPGNTVHQMWSPGLDGYSERKTSSIGEYIESTTITALRIETEGLV